MDSLFTNFDLARIDIFFIRNSEVIVAVELKKHMASAHIFLFL